MATNKVPADRGALLTEQVRAGEPIDRLSVRDAVSAMNAEDAFAVRAVEAAGDEIAAVIERVVACWRAGGRLLYIGAGTSGRLGVLDASECPPTFKSPPEMVVGLIAGGDVALRRSVENVEDHADEGAAAIAAENVSAKDCVVGIASGGTTPYVHGALAEARRRGAATVFMTCVSGVDAAADHTIRLLTGPEVVTGSTRLKAGTATKLALNMITTIGFAQMGKVYNGLMVDVNARINSKLVDRAARMISRLTGLSRDDSLALLDAADGKVKVALVMHEHGVDHQEASAILDKAGGRLQDCMGKK